MHSLQQVLRDSVRALTESTRGLFVGVSGAVHEGLRVNTGRATETEELARPDTSLSHTASQDANADASGSHAKPASVSAAALMPKSFEATILVIIRGVIYNVIFVALYYHRCAEINI